VAGMPVAPLAPFRSDTSQAEALTSPKMQLSPIHDTDAQPTTIKPEHRLEVSGPNLLPPLPSSALPAVPVAKKQDEGSGFGDEPTASAGSAGEMAKIVQAEKRLAKDPPDEAEAEMQQVYQDFIETKQRLGEPIDGITYEKFIVKLKANRQQLISRYGCKTVKFQVYVKDGKAALKATPA
jgi:hypothetical protein